MTETQAQYKSTTGEPLYEIRLTESGRQGVLTELNSIKPLPNYLCMLRMVLNKAEPMMKF
jgi:hypothetical protein